MNAYQISQEEKSYLRILANKLAEYAQLPIMQERKTLWFEHNGLKAGRPPIVMEWTTFPGDIMPKLQCKSEAAADIESYLLGQIINHELIDDDKVIDARFPISLQLTYFRPAMDSVTQHARDTEGREIGYHIEPAIKDITKMDTVLKTSEFSVDRESTFAWKDFVDSTIGDIIPTYIANTSACWLFGLSAIAVHLLSMEYMFVAMMDYPEEFHRLMEFITEDTLSFVKWQEDEHLLVLNNGNDYVGAGSYGFTTELPRTDTYKNTGKVTCKDLWCNMNSQESVGLSPMMFKEFMFPYYQRIAREFGLVYYGCCEPVHEIWDICLRDLENLRKVSVSAWCDEEFIGERLRGAGITYSRKPSPNFIGVGNELNEKAYREHVSHTLRSAKGCSLEFIFRDIYTLNGNIHKPARAIEILREQIDKLW